MVQIENPYHVLGVICFLALIVSYAGYEGRKERQEAQAYAQSQGWKFSVNDDQGLKGKVANICQDLAFDVYHVRTIQTGQLGLYLFDCNYKSKDAGPRVHDSHGTACFVQSGRFRSSGAPLEICARDWTEGLVSDKVDMGPSPFAEKFLVICEDPVSARGVVDESTEAILLEHRQKPLYNPVNITIAAGGAVVLTGRTGEPERMQDLVELARRLESTAH